MSENKRIAAFGVGKLLFKCPDQWSVITPDLEENLLILRSSKRALIQLHKVTFLTAKQLIYKCNIGYIYIGSAQRVPDTRLLPESQVWGEIRVSVQGGGGHQKKDHRKDVES